MCARHGGQAGRQLRSRSRRAGLAANQAGEEAPQPVVLARLPLLRRRRRRLLLGLRRRLLQLLMQLLLLRLLLLRLLLLRLLLLRSAR